MKYFNPFDCLQTYQCNNKYTLGIEIEFYSETEKYTHNVKGNWTGILGYDGAGFPTGEYRSPIFRSKVPRIAFHGLVSFTNQIIQYLNSNFEVYFSPIRTIKKEGYWCEDCRGYHKESYFDIPFGIHFTIGGKFISDGQFIELFDRAQKCQEHLINIVEDKELYLKRESSMYSGKFKKDKSLECNAYKIKKSMGFIPEDASFGIWSKECSLLEFRFFPSCQFYTLIPYLRYILLGGELPNSIIKFDNLDKYGKEKELNGI